MRRREFITLLGGAAAAWPLAARAQQPMPVVGFLFSGAQQGASAAIKRAFDQGLSDEGYVEGQNVIIKYKWAEGHYDRLPALAADLGSQRVAVLAVSFNRPAGNLTGVYVLFNELIAKQMEVLHELVPAAETIAILDNSANPSSDLRWREMQKAGGTLGVKVLSMNVGTERELDSAFALLRDQQAGAIIVAPDTFLSSRRDQILALTARHALPVLAAFREYPVAGGLVSYGPDLVQGYRQLGVFGGRVLRGAKPADLPVEQSTKVEFVVNLRTARALRMNIPLPLIGRADEVIE
jgi:putative tryptophan/tyrosine transport system substrate-binding protein